jgi:hypothetical protein
LLIAGTVKIITTILHVFVPIILKVINRKENCKMIHGYPGIYRGTIVYNKDPKVKGRCKIFVHGVYPDEFFKDWNLLPWAEPAMAIMGRCMD